VLLGVGLAALIGGLAGAILLQDNGGGTRNGGGGGFAPRGPIHLSGTTGYDPFGNPPGQEHNEDAGKATDNDPTTFWTTESYVGAQLGKKGVGVLLSAGRKVSPRTMRVTTDTDGFTAVIRAGDSSSGPFRDVSPSETVSGTTSFPIHGSGSYFVIWITDLGGNSAVHVNEVRATG
jgi:hypothetical protein